MWVWLIAVAANSFPQQVPCDFFLKVLVVLGKCSQVQSKYAFLLPDTLHFLPPLGAPTVKAKGCLWILGELPSMTLQGSRLGAVKT